MLSISQGTSAATEHATSFTVAKVDVGSSGPMMKTFTLLEICTRTVERCISGMEPAPHVMNARLGIAQRNASRWGQAR